MKIFAQIVIVAAAIVILGYLAFGNKTPDTTMIRVTTPTPNSVVRSPLVVTGVARGNWYFEASFPIRLYDANGREIAVAVAQAQGEWMTTEFVPFETKLIFISPSAEQTGTLVLQKDNPSGLPENDSELRIPVRFGGNDSQTRIIKLFYYNQLKDVDASGNIMCSEGGLEPVEREIPLSITPIQDAIKLLLQGEITFTEQGRGIATEFPLPSFELKAASLTGGSLTLTFADPENKTSGGSCRVNILRAQIEKTAKQFPEVSQVHLVPEELFQP